MDVVSFNRYYGWYPYPTYNDPGYTGAIRDVLSKEIELWHIKHNRPVMLSEYGADAVAGLRKVRV